MYSNVLQYYLFYYLQDYIEKGLFSIIYETDTLQDFLHVENLAQAHELAGRALTDDKNFIAVSSQILYKYLTVKKI